MCNVLRARAMKSAVSAIKHYKATEEQVTQSIMKVEEQSLVMGLENVNYVGREMLEVPVGLCNGTMKWVDIRKAPHIMVTGATGMGKSVWINSLLGTLIRNDPSQVHIYLVDPLRVELSPFKKLPHVKGFATNVQEAAELINKLTEESNQRYELFERAGARTLEEYNETTGRKLPYIIAVLDEFAQLTGQKQSKVKEKKEAANSFEEDMVTLAETARKSGIHLIAATQNPTAQIINSRMKTNFPTKITFKLDATAAQLVLKIKEAATLNKPGELEYRGPGAEAYRAQGLYVTINKG